RPRPDSPVDTEERTGPARDPRSRDETQHDAVVRLRSSRPDVRTRELFTRHGCAADALRGLVVAERSPVSERRDRSVRVLRLRVRPGVPGDPRRPRRGLLLAPVSDRDYVHGYSGSEQTRLVDQATT